MLHLRRDREQERGQVMVLAAISFIVILAFAAIVIDLGFLRNNRQILVNTRRLLHRHADGPGCGCRRSDQQDNPGQLPGPADVGLHDRVSVPGGR
jgi:hypothetical protein